MRAIRILVFLNLTLSIVLFSIGLVEQFEFPKYLFRILTICLCGGILAYGARANRRRHLREAWARVVGDPIGLGFGLFLVSAALSTVFSVSPRISVYGMLGSYAGLISIASYVALYFLTRWAFQAPDDARRLLKAALLGSVICAAYGAAQFFGGDPMGWHDMLGAGWLLRPPSTGGHPNYTSAELVMALPLFFISTMAALREKRPAQAAFGAAGALLFLFAIVVMRSRGSWLALAAVVFAFVTLRLGLRRRLVLLWLGVAAAAGGLMLVIRSQLDMAALAASQPMLRDFLDRFKDILSPGGARTEYIKAGLHMFREHPLLGVGPDLYQLSFANSRPPDYWLMEWQGVASRAHNELVNIAATQGLLGLVATLALVVGFAMTALRCVHKPVASTRARRDYGIALVAGGIGFFVQDLSSFTVSMTGTLFVTFAALLSNEAFGSDGKTSEATVATDFDWYPLALAASMLATAWVLFHSFWPVKETAAWVFAALLGVLVLTAAFLLLSEAKPGTQSRRDGLGALGVTAVFAVIAGKLVAIPLEASVISQYAVELGKLAPHWALLQSEKAEELDKTEPLYLNQVALLAAAVSVQNAQNKDLKLAREFRDLEIRAYEHATKIVPARSDYHYSYATALAQRFLDGTNEAGDHQLIINELTKVLELEPYNPVYLAGTIATEIMLGEIGRAFVHARAAVAAYPGYSVFHYQLGHTAIPMREYELAVDQLKRALAGKSFTDSAAHWRDFIEFDPVIQFTVGDRERAKKDLASAEAALQKR